MTNEQLEKIAEKFGKKPYYAGAKNEQIKWIDSIYNNKRPNPRKLFVIEGIWAHKKAYESNIIINSLFICPELIYTAEAGTVAEKFMELAENIIVVSEKVFNKISEKSGKPDGLISVCQLTKTSLDSIPLSKNNLVIILDGIEIPGNAGTIVRSMEGAGGDGVIFTNRKTRLTHPKLIRSSQCACFTMPMIEEDTDNVIKWLHDNNFQIFLLDTDAKKEYHEFSYEGRIAFIAGSEKYGISESWYNTEHTKTFIPMFGSVADSLNVAIASTIVLYEASLSQKGHFKYSK